MFGSGNKVKLSDTVYQKAKVASGLLGCSLEDFIERAVEGEADRALSSASSREPSQAEVEEIAKQLKGLGYLE